MNRWLKTRLVLDRAVAALAVVVFAPAVALLAVLVNRQDGGPAFVRVERTGRDFKPFMMWKLRSMRADLPGGRAGGTALTAENDDRITPLGRRLRSCHLDEIPQLLNVLKGEMLLIGPRPETPEYVDRNDARWQIVLQVPPGIAGPSAVIVGDWESRLIAADPNGPAYPELVLPVKLAIDRWYVETMSPTRDLAILVASAKLLLGVGRHTKMSQSVAREVPEVIVLRDDFSG